jgi:hypothetical protein
VKPKTPVNPNELKMIVQYRSNHGKTYELQAQGNVLAVHISPPDNPEDPGKWHVQARLGAAAGPSIADGYGASGADALRETARAWTSQIPLPAVFDWEAVTRLLQTVRAV